MQVLHREEVAAVAELGLEESSEVSVHLDRDEHVATQPVSCDGEEKQEFTDSSHKEDSWRNMNEKKLNFGHVTSPEKEWQTLLHPQCHYLSSTVLVTLSCYYMPPFFQAS